MNGEIDAAREFRLAWAIEDLVAADAGRGDSMSDPGDQDRAVVDDLIWDWVVWQRVQVFSNN